MPCSMELPGKQTLSDCNDHMSSFCDDFCELELGDLTPLDSPIQVTERTGPLEVEEWNRMMDPDGRIINETALRKTIFKGGICSKIRQDVWRFLFGLYPFSSTVRERHVIYTENFTKYNAQKARWKEDLLVYQQQHQNENEDLQQNNVPIYIRECKEWSRLNQGGEGGECSKPKSLCDDQLVFLNLTAKVNASRQVIDFEKLLNSIRIIDKDVPRTDRGQSFFSGKGNPNLLVLRDILITYAAYHQDVGYCQGMNDIISRFLVVLESEEEAYCCFVHYMEHVKGDFLDSGMMKKIELVRKLLKQLDEQLATHFMSSDMGDMLFVHRWMVLAFKREFCFSEALKLFEILSSQHLELSSMEAEKERDKQRSKERERDGGEFQTELVGLDAEFTFDLFICLAVLREHRELFLECKEISAIYNAMNSISMKMDLNVILVKAEELFFHYCRKSVMDCFEVVEPLEEKAKQRMRYVRVL